MVDPDDLHRLFYEALAELGSSADPAKLVELVQRLDHGLPAEDEFTVICSWLGKCRLIHKLDQHQLPQSSKEDYQVPDLLAYFATQATSHPVLVEVKAKKDRTISFKPDYLQRLTNYSELISAPLLIAWKYHSVWVLFEAKHLRKAKTNWNISFDEALKENLLGVLVGDLAYKVGVGAGIHLRFDKEELLDTGTEGQVTTESWKMRVGEVAFTDRDGNLVSDLSPEVQSLFATWELEVQEDHAKDHIWKRFVAPDQGLQFAHIALVKLLDWSRPSEEDLSWRREARKDKLNTISDIKFAVEKALDEKVVQLVLHQHPTTMPDFLPGVGVGKNQTQC